MQEPSPYDSFAEDYDRFVNWPGRLGFELPFIQSILGSAQHVLDAACATGQHALALAERGYQVSGVDSSPAMIARARQIAAQRGLEVRFEAAPFSELPQVFGRDSFDAVLCLGNSLPHVLDQAGLAASLQAFAAVLRPGGLLLIQNRNFDQVLEQQERWMEPQEARDEDREWLFIRFYDFLPDGNLNFNILRLSRQAGGPWHQALTTTRLHPLTRTELSEALQRAGFTTVSWYGGLDGASFDPAASPNLVALANLKQ